MSNSEQVRAVDSNVGTVFQPRIGPSTQGLGEQLVREGTLADEEAFRRVRDEGLAIVRRCKAFDEKPGRRTGLVVGYVQSGKTMSMTTVTSLARDNGCRIIVLLAGVTTNLLRQNASRFRETLRAAAEGREHWLIINSEDGKNRGSDAQTLRQAVTEWHDRSIPAEEQRTLFLAVLKNHAHLDWLRALLAKESLASIPALILDDEADQAGLNVRPDDDPSTTYKRIEAVRAALPNHTYLQYTATPQAPLLISIDDLLSPEFAELVEPGEQYRGGLAFFPEKEPPALVRIIPQDDRFKPGKSPDTPPDSLKAALSVFFVACAVARKSGVPKTRSMLIHPSPRKADQEKFLIWSQEIQKHWSRGVAADESDPDRQDVLDELRLGYDDLLKTNHDLPPFEDLVPQLKLTLSRTLSKTVNSEDASEVDWKNGSDHILVGGEKLNRGYTVEGLIVTYMPRDAGGFNADTIQQRARFFGYKGKYLSLCRVYLHPDVAKAFADYVVHERDVRRQLSEHRGRPLREWRRAFFMDAKMRPTRSNVLTDELHRVKKERPWFVQRYPHREPEAVLFNKSLVERFTAGLTFAKDANFADLPVAKTTLQNALDGLLLEFRAAHEAVIWYAHLVLLSDLRASNPDSEVFVVQMGDRKKPRERTPDKTTEALTLHQGRSSAAEGGYVGDAKMLTASAVTIQIHCVKIKESSPPLIVDAIAVAVPGKEHDTIASGHSV